jgi:hypothetical protein
MAELAEGARLLSECAVKAAPRVRIPLSPPHAIKPGIPSRVFYKDNYLNFVDKTLR